MNSTRNGIGNYRRTKSIGSAEVQEARPFADFSPAAVLARSADKAARIAAAQAQVEAARARGYEVVYGTADYAVIARSHGVNRGELLEAAMAGSVSAKGGASC